MGYTWHRDSDGEYILKDKFLLLSEAEAEAYLNAANEIYAMYEAGAAYVIEKNLFDALDIPKSLVETIKRSFKTERGKHLYGRFDLSGGIDSKEIKLIEFNADTPTLLLESAVMQQMMLLLNKELKLGQFNNIFESIAKQFVKISKQKKGLYSKFLFSSVRGIEEERVTVKLLEDMAKSQGLLTAFAYLEECDMEVEYDFWFKLYPWEDMPNFQANEKTTMLNPAYTLLYQSKGMLAILYELFPESPYLLKTAFTPIKEKYVKKRMFGREGANIEIVEDEKVLKETKGIYSEYKAVYQEYVDFVRDKEGQYYQAGVFYSGGACGVGFRRGAEILDDMSEFVAHGIKK
ncbi:glutathionylspermidine synthase family protein [Sulfurimonas sp. SAG-AH-194-L11]|nr:glutathionylspermidine synthase family protein [Sulfurimonas sp. SAG-AH-194-L11]